MRVDWAAAVDGLEDYDLDREREIALYLLQSLVELVGDPTRMIVDLWQMHRIILIMRGIMVEADQQLSADADFDRVATTLAGMIAAECKSARTFRQQNGIGLMDLVLSSDRPVH